jgi:hypothetical protein
MPTWISTPALFRTLAVCTGFAWLCLELASYAFAAETTAIRSVRSVRFPAYDSANTPRFRPYVELLQHALDRTAAKYGPARALPSSLRMTEARYALELEGGRLDVIWGSTSIEREERLLPVRIPLDKGLLSYRIAFIDGSQQGRIDEVKTLAQLRGLQIGQGVGWGDVDVYRFNGIPVQTAAYESLFSMVAGGRFDLFPRGIGEVFEEFAVYAPHLPKLAIEHNLALFYPWPYYFFFNRNNAALAARVEEGLREMIRDGSFETLFRKNYGEAIRRANLAHRRLIRLENPFLPAGTPLTDPTLWLRLPPQ